MTSLTPLLWRHYSDKARLQPDVDRYNERKKQQRTLELLQAKLPWMKFEEIRNRYVAKKAELDALLKVVNATKARMEPDQISLDMSKKDEAILQKQKDDLKKKLTGVEVELTKAHDQLEDISTKFVTLGEDLAESNKAKISFDQKFVFIRN